MKVKTTQLNEKKNIHSIHSQITKDEKVLPQKICTICITYLKHAITFRRQVINNSRYLQQPAGMQTQFSMFGEAFNPRFLMGDDGTDYDDIDGAPWDDLNLAPENETFDDLKMEMERAFGGELDETEDEDEDDDDPGVLFNYKEKCFEEDDISDLGSNIVITIPDNMRERKCNACRQRFMLKESYEQHAKECIELKLNKFINEGYQLLQMRQSRTLSANEFVRRLIFALKKVMKSLSVCHKEVPDQPLTMSEDKLTKKMNFFDLADDSFKLKKSMNNGVSHLTQLCSTTAPAAHIPSTEQNTEQQSKYLLDLLEGKPNVSIQKNHLAGNNNKSPIMSNPLLAALSNSMHSNQNNEQPHRVYDEYDSHEQPPRLPRVSGASQLAQALAQSKHIEKPTFAAEENVVVAQCAQCSEPFSSIAAFEDHIRNKHKARTTPIQTSANTVSFIGSIATNIFDNSLKFTKKTVFLSSSSILSQFH